MQFPYHAVASMLSVPMFDVNKIAIIFQLLYNYSNYILFILYTWHSLESITIQFVTYTCMYMHGSCTHSLLIYTLAISQSCCCAIRNFTFCASCNYTIITITLVQLQLLSCRNAHNTNMLFLFIHKGSPHKVVYIVANSCIQYCSYTSVANFYQLHARRVFTGLPVCTVCQ